MFMDYSVEYLRVGTIFLCRGFLNLFNAYFILLFIFMV